MARMLSTAALAAFALAVPASSGSALADEEMFIVREIGMEREDAVAAVRERVEQYDEWLFLAEFGLAGDRATALKICYLPIGPDLVAAGMHVMAMMPCGNLAFYENEEGESMLSMLDLRFMTALSDDPRIANAAQAGAPAFERLLQETLGVD